MASKSPAEDSLRNGRVAAPKRPENAGQKARAWARATQVAIIGLFVIAVLCCAYVAQHVIVPVLLAWTIATIVLPIMKWMESRGVPRAVAAVLVTILLITLILTLILLLSAPLTYWLGRASYVGALLREKLESFGQPLALLQELQRGLNAIGAGNQSVLKVEAQSTSIVAGILALITPAVSGFVIFVFSLMFYLIYRQRLRSSLVYLLSDREARLATLRTLSDIDDNMTTYFGTFTIINLGLGIVAAALTWAIGLPNPLLWGALAFLLNYVPYIGPAIMIATLAVVGLLIYPTLQEALLAPLLYLVVVTIEGQFMTPTLMGRRLEINPFAVFLSIAFSTWLWGPVGAFLAVPLLIAVSVTLENVCSEEKPALPD